MQTLFIANLIIKCKNYLLIRFPIKISVDQKKVGENIVAAPALKAILVCTIVWTSPPSSRILYLGTGTVNKLGHWAGDSNKDSG